MLGAWLAAGMTVAHAADSPARLREDDASIESKLQVPDGIEPGRYDVHPRDPARQAGTGAHDADGQDRDYRR